MNGSTIDLLDAASTVNENTTTRAPQVQQNVAN